MKITIPWKLPGYNEYINKCRHNRYTGANFKRNTEESICFVMMNRPKIKTPCKLKITFFEPNKRRDYDNIVSAKKFILDSMVKVGLIPDDNQKHIEKIEDDVLVDKNYPRVEIEVIS